MGSHDPMRALDPDGPRCRARNRRGEQCRHPAIPGGTVCRYHGGAAPQVLEAARRRLGLLALGAVDVLAEAVEGTDVNGVAIPYAARVKAAAELLDRAGVTVLRQEQVVRHEVEGKVTAELGPAILAALAETRELAAEHRARALEAGAASQRPADRTPGEAGPAAAEPALGEPEVVDAEVVEGSYGGAEWAADR